ncbi:hypothetical protein ACFY5J_11655 [Peribacillus butanolivorans]|jgi:hypothetical protein|uniref:Flagellin Flp1-like domain-containing protein n=1 Tax=Peribacillus butanolivorans TaxID=421767 RepID=A0AAX0RRG2_9BACI|nr:hypothetical protein [Peribacillus butanolivorans]KRF55110.1 hypothetical protein ASG99_10260 [Bacillus sp. Soil768D1]AXN39930.1 hypothetical protein DTO10_17230 [Peribacillus butanolivorans]KON67908.1 hypothetical protein AKG34_03115 [Peribacillus butanolivorans]MCO0597289.1 hypothetical protein [Peribacillus butanolivorans]MED3690481.1 hypothetical protein [Peribacillus butanolivorans]
MKEWMLKMFQESSGNLIELITVTLIAGLIGLVIICVRGLFYKALDFFSIPVGRLIEKLVKRN